MPAVDVVPLVRRYCSEPNPSVRGAAASSSSSPSGPHPAEVSSAGMLRGLATV